MCDDNSEYTGVFKKDNSCLTQLERCSELSSKVLCIIL